MRIVRYEKDGVTRYGIVEGGVVRPVSGDIFGEWSLVEPSLPVESVKLLAPCIPSKIVAVGLNYRDHIAEMKDELPECPKIFLKPSTAVVGPLDPIVMPPSSQRVDYEAEMAIVVSRVARNVAASSAKDYILGYTCLNDVTARDLQKVDGQWTRAKSFDTFAPIGPAIVTDVDPTSLDIMLVHNGEVKQRSNTSYLIFDPYTLLSFISSVMTLLPGDVIATGTPSGVGPMSPGDTVEVRISGIGSLVNTAVASER